MNLPDDQRIDAFIKVWEELIAKIDDTAVTPQSAHVWHFTNKALRSQTKIITGPPISVQRPKVSPGSQTTPKTLPFGISLQVDDMLNEAEYLNEILARRGATGTIGRVAVLNMASANKAGGGVCSGALNAQEEDLSRRTNLMISISPKYNKVLWPTGSTYNIPDNGLIYSPGVMVLRDNRTEDYRWLPADRLFKVDVVSSAAINLSKISVQQRNKERWLNDMWPKAIALFTSVVDNNVNRLVLAPWGAGAFGAEPEWTGQLFAEAIIALFSDGKYPNKFLNLVSIVSVPDRGTTTTKTSESLTRLWNAMTETFEKFKISSPYV